MPGGEFLEQGNIAYRSREFRDAVKYFTQGLEENPDHHVLLSNRSAAYLHLEDADASLADADRVLALKPSWPKGYGRRATALIALGRMQEAMDTFERGLQQAPNDGALASGLADLRNRLASQGGTPSGKPAVLSASQGPAHSQSRSVPVREMSDFSSDPGASPGIVLQSGNALNNLGDALGGVPLRTSPVVSPAKQSQSDALNSALPPGSPPQTATAGAAALAQSGETALEAGDAGAAVDLFTEALALEPRNAAILARRSKGHLNLGDRAAALRDAEDAIALDVACIDAYLRLADLYFRDGMYGACAQALSRGVCAVPPAAAGPLRSNLQDLFAFVDAQSAAPADDAEGGSVRDEAGGGGHPLNDVEHHHHAHHSPVDPSEGAPPRKRKGLKKSAGRGPRRVKARSTASSVPMSLRAAENPSDPAVASALARAKERLRRFKDLDAEKVEREANERRWVEGRRALARNLYLKPDGRGTSRGDVSARTSEAPAAGAGYGWAQGAGSASTAARLAVGLSAVGGAAGSVGVGMSVPPPGMPQPKYSWQQPGWAASQPRAAASALPAGVDESALASMGWLERQDYLDRLRMQEQQQRAMEEQQAAAAAAAAAADAHTRAHSRFRSATTERPPLHTGPLRGRTRSRSPRKPATTRRARRRTAGDPGAATAQASTWQMPGSAPPTGSPSVPSVSGWSNRDIPAAPPAHSIGADLPRMNINGTVISPAFGTPPKYDGGGDIPPPVAPIDNLSDDMDDDPADEPVAVPAAPLSIDDVWDLPQQTKAERDLSASPAGPAGGRSRSPSQSSSIEKEASKQRSRRKSESKGGSHDHQVPELNEGDEYMGGVVTRTEERMEGGKRVFRTFVRSVKKVEAKVPPPVTTTTHHHHRTASVPVHTASHAHHHTAVASTPVVHTTAVHSLGHSHAHSHSHLHGHTVGLGHGHVFGSSVLPPAHLHGHSHSVWGGASGFGGFGGGALTAASVGGLSGWGGF